MSAFFAIAKDAKYKLIRLPLLLPKRDFYKRDIPKQFNLLMRFIDFPYISFVPPSRNIYKPINVKEVIDFTISKIISNDKFRKELEEFDENEPGIWNDWILENRIGYKFEVDKNGEVQFVPDELIDEYKTPSCVEIKHESALIKFWEETDLMIANSGESFGWSDLY